MEQSEWTRKTTRSVEITVESHEVTLYQTPSTVGTGRMAEVTQPYTESSAETDKAGLSG